MSAPWRFAVRPGLAVKLAACLVVSTAAFFAVFGYLNLRLQRRQSEEMVLQSADRISDLIQRSTRYQMLRNDREALYQVIQTIGSEPGIRRIRIFNEEGRISYSTDPAEVDTYVDKRAEAACHAHPAERRILGVIDTDLSLAPVDAQLATHQAQLVRFTVLALILSSLVSVLFVWVVAHKPVKELMAGTKKVAAGDLAYRLPVRSRDELGELAASFNKMTEELARAQQELTGWARTLEERVERKTSELRQAQAHLVASEKMAALGKLAATVAHEVNNPLSGILTYARLTQKALEADGRDPAKKTEMLEQLRIIERESRRCGDIMRNLLTFARQAPPQREPQQLNTLVERTLALVQHRLELQGIELEKNLDAAAPPVACDAGQIQQVLLALLVNAAEAMPRGGRLRVSTAYDPEARRVETRVADTGPGIPADVLPLIFEPFFTTKEDGQRTGLGLAV